MRSGLRVVISKQGQCCRVGKIDRAIWGDAWRLAEAGFFSPGSDVLQAEGLPVVDSIAEKLREVRYNLRVEGHTDNIPIRTARFPSNWELSTSRATHVLRYLISEAGIPPSRLSAVGHGSQSHGRLIEVTRNKRLMASSLFIPLQ